MDLIQYWHEGRPPGDVARLIARMRRDNPDFEHRLFDRASAVRFIDEHWGPRERIAFETCAVPAMQADYFRLCALITTGGVYADADSISRRPLRTLFAQSPRNLMVTLDGYLTTGLMGFWRPGDAFLRAVLNLATENIEQRRFGNVYVVTGPPVADAIRALLDASWLDAMISRCDEWARGMRFGRLLDHARALTPVTEELTAAYQDLRLIEMKETRPWQDIRRASYKRTPMDWRRWKGSIFDPEAAPQCD